MSNRTSEANKAIDLAWTKEQQLIRDGKGTRDWTPEQQQSILERGKAYGDDGKAFEGHHMKSAERFPEYQGDPENIQFLSRQEHFVAHDRNFKNSTNGCFNPHTGKTIDFGLNKYEPCEILELSEPVAISGCQAQEITRNFDDSPDKGTYKATFKAHTPIRLKTTEKGGFGGVVKRYTGYALKIYNRYKSIIDPAVKGFALGAASGIVKEIFSGSSKSNSSKYESDGYYDYSTYSSSPAASGDGTDSFQHEDANEHASPSEHVVSAHRQRYKGEWKDKSPYKRGKNHDD